MWSSGTLLGGRYALAERIGSGAMGEVWRSEDRVLERQVAVKILLPSRYEDDAFTARFRREAKVLAAIDHPGVVQVHDYGEHEFSQADGESDSAGDSVTRVAYIVMELVEGRSLDEIRAERGLLPVAQALDIVAQALDALHAVHRRGVVHRDIKPSNLMLRDDGRVAVADFGIASVEADTRITGTRKALGTPLYMAPEQAEGLPVVPASDLYSIGVVCYELLSGVPPFTGGSAVEVALKHIREPVADLPADIPEPVRTFVVKALAKDSEDRFVSAAVMSDAARRAAAGDQSGGTRGPVQDVTPEPRASPGTGTGIGPGTGTGSEGGGGAVAGATAEDGPAAGSVREKRRSPVVVLAAVLVPAATATVLYVVPMPWSTGADAPPASPSAPGDRNPGQASPSRGAGANDGGGDPGGTAPGSKLGPGWDDRGVIQPKQFPATNHFWMADINKDRKAEFVTVDKSQHFRFWWNSGPSSGEKKWIPFVEGKNSYAPAAGAVGNMQRFGDIDGDGFPDCMVVGLTGKVTAHTWKGEDPSGARMCMNPYDGVADVFSNGSTGEPPVIDPSTRIRFADVTGGGRDDYLLIEADGTTTAWYNRGFQVKGDRKHLDWAPPRKISGALENPGEIRYADIDGDGRADRIHVTAKGGARAWINEGDQGQGGTFRDIGRIARDAEVPPKDVQFADIDGDGRADFLRIGWTGVTHAWLNKLKPGYFDSLHR